MPANGQNSPMLVVKYTRQCNMYTSRVSMGVFEGCKSESIVSFHAYHKERERERKGRGEGRGGKESEGGIIFSTHKSCKVAGEGKTELVHDGFRQRIADKLEKRKKNNYRPNGPEGALFPRHVRVSISLGHPFSRQMTSLFSYPRTAAEIWVPKTRN
eukprot:1379298-Amorphochlora_amoeboformis.AAC.1